VLAFGHLSAVLGLQPINCHSGLAAHATDGGFDGGDREYQELQAGSWYETYHTFMYEKEVAATTHQCDLPLPKPLKGAILASNFPGIWRMSDQIRWLCPVSYRRSASFPARLPSDSVVQGATMCG
jgi:hypothetical protein